MRLIALLPLVGILGACGGSPAATEVRIQTAFVPIAAPCPSKDEYAKLKATRPRPLVSQPMPATTEERVAKTAAQLGRFEAPGGWADRTEAALDRCQNNTVLTPSP